MVLNIVKNGTDSSSILECVKKTFNSSKVNIKTDYEISVDIEVVGDEWTDDDICSEEPRWVNNGTDSVHQKDGYTLIYNSTIGGVYMLYREANAAETEWYNKLN